MKQSIKNTTKTMSVPHLTRKGGFCLMTFLTFSLLNSILSSCSMFLIS
ncbi:MAG: hypothetical protein IJ548_08000 [Paludibacteraceae bacterium]|nr:hypothetical protein [Paludibacteraceae bacterium]MBQ8715280.1 hypothetical protein [Prevotella sp.]